MDSIINWIMNIPNDTMASKIITCNYGSNVHNEAIAGNLVAGTFLLVGYRRNDYANVTAYSYWKGNAMSIATIENNVWAKRFDKVITNTDLFSVHFIAQTFNGYVEYFDARIKSDMNCVASIKYSGVVLNYILNVQVHNGSFIIYVRTPEGTIPQDNTNVNIYAIFAK